MVTPADYIAITLIEKRLAFCREVALLRQQNALIEGRRPKNNAPTDVMAALALSDQGLLGEAATMIFLSPCKWDFFKQGDLRGLPDITVGRHAIDAKTRRMPHHRLIVQYDDPSEWFYVLACASEAPLIRLIGWCRGEEAKQARYDGDPVGGRPAYWIGHDEPILKPMRDLRTLLHGPGAH